MEEILQSQDAMLQRLGKSRPASEEPADISKAYRQQERHAKSWCATAGVHGMCVSFHALVHRPDEVLPQLAGFLGRTEKLPAMRACIDPALHHAQAVKRRIVRPTPSTRTARAGAEAVNHRI